MVVAVGAAFFGCRGVKEQVEDESVLTLDSTLENTAQTDDIETIKSAASTRGTQMTKDTFPREPITFTKNINGKSIEVALDGAFYKSIEFEGQEYPLEIKEVYPGIVYYDNYDSIKVLAYRQEDSIMLYQRVKGVLEFYDNGELVKRYDIDAQNPYLKSGEGISIIQNFSDAEGEAYVPPEKRAEFGNVNVWQVHSHVENQGSFSKIIYFRKEMVDGVWIVGTTTTMVVLDSLGNELWNHKYTGHTSQPAISPNGRYALFAIMPIETVNNAGIKTQTEGFEIWDTQTSTLLHREMNDDPDMWIGAPGCSIVPSVLGMSYSFHNSNNANYRLNSSNPVSKVIHFDYLNKQLYEYYVSVKSVDASHEYFLKHREYPSWEKIASELELNLKPLNYGK